MFFVTEHSRLGGLRAEVGGRSYHELTDRTLAGQGLSRTSVPERGRTVLLRETANLSTGGEAIDRTD